LFKHDGISITDSGELSTKGATTADLTAVNSEFAKKYPTLVTQYVKAFVKSYDIFKNEPDRADSIVAKHLDIDKETAKQQMAGNNYISAKDQITSKYLGQKNKAGDLAKTLKSTADFHVDQKNLEKSGELSLYQGAVNGSFVEEALT
jgi:taurine transport system substrate-binding protein